MRPLSGRGVIPESAEPGKLSADDAKGAGEQRGSWLGWKGMLANCAFWAGFALLTSANYLSPAGSESAPFIRTVLVVSLFQAAIWAVLTPIIFWIVSRFSLEQGSRMGRSAAFIAAAPFVALAVGITGFIVIAPTGPLPTINEESRGFIGVLLRLRFLNNVLIYLAIVAAGVARDSSFRYRERREETIRLQASNAETQAHLQAQLAEARLAMLRSQLNPHFLFNTLNALSALVDEDPPRAQQMIARLSELLRYTLEGADEREIPLWREMRLTERYLEILEIRYHGRLTTSVSLGPEVRDALVPSLILQPLVENAMTHGVSRAGGYGRIDVSAALSSGSLVLTVRDTGGGDGEQVTEPSAGSRGSGGGMGLRHTRSRLAEHYGEAPGVSLSSDPSGATIAEIMLPFRPAPAADARPLPEPLLHA